MNYHDNEDAGDLSIMGAADAAAARAEEAEGPFFLENCADAWADALAHEAPEDRYCTYGLACDQPMLTADTIGPNGDLQCRDCYKVELEREVQFMEDDSDYF